MNVQSECDCDVILAALADSGVVGMLIKHNLKSKLDLVGFPENGPVLIGAHNLLNDLAFKSKCSILEENCEHGP